MGSGLYQDGSTVPVTVEFLGNDVTVNGTTHTGALSSSEIAYFKLTLGGNGSGAVYDNFSATVGATYLEPPTISADPGLILSGGSTDLTIGFDATAETAVLTTPGGPVDLIALDDGVTNGDPVADDGEVVVSESPTATFTYQVETTKTGFSPTSASVEVIVIDFTEPTDNALSSEIKADSPLFYYRFEEAVGAGYLWDSSGNGHHTADITGTFTQGAGPAGVGNAGECPEDVSILVPATSAMNASFTICAAVSTNQLIKGGAGGQHIVSMTDGGGVGRSILYFARNNGLLTSFMDGTNLQDAGSSLIPENTMCLLHMVYDADTGDGTDDPELRFYVNGVLNGTVAVGALDANVGNWVLASNKQRTADFSLDGWLDETAVFESVLSDTRIAAHASAYFAAADPSLGFDSDVTAVAGPGSPVTLTWLISDQATAVTLNGANQPITPGTYLYTTTVYPSVTTTYTLVVSSSGGDVTREITVVVPIFAITGITYDGGDVTLTVKGAPNTTYNVQASATLADGFPDFVGTVTTNGSGDAIYGPFPGVGSAEFYRLETQP